MPFPTFSIPEKAALERVLELKQALQKKMTEHNITIARMAILSGLPDATLYSFFKTGSSPKIETIIKIADGLDMKPSELLAELGF